MTVQLKGKQLVVDDSSRADRETAVKALRRQIEKNKGIQKRRIQSRRRTHRAKCLRTVWRRPLDRTPNIGSGGQKMGRSVALFEGVHPQVVRMGGLE